LGEILPPEDFGDTAVGDLEYSGDVARPGSGVSQLHNLLPCGIRKRSPTHEHTSKLIYSAVPFITKHTFLKEISVFYSYY
jgi:hypothetical protein